MMRSGLDQASAQALGFVARRLLAEPVALVIATREPGREFSGLPELLVGGLRDSDARELLRSVIMSPVDERVVDRIVAETRGNPLALLDLPRVQMSAESGPGFGLQEAPEVSVRVEDSFRRRFEALPPTAQRLLLVAAAELTGEPTGHLTVTSSRPDSTDVAEQHSRAQAGSRTHAASGQSTQDR